ncbi:MAG: hypothetical protein ABF747_08970, partial [Bifidobacterium sp.]|uniref:hypothetical protein n=1 Tax=Bifidobacterium sp. TaxID=41200 RepID=UPI0039EBBFCB
IKSSTNTLLSSQTTTTPTSFVLSLGEIRRVEQRSTSLHSFGLFRIFAGVIKPRDVENKRFSRCVGFM